MSAVVGYRPADRAVGAVTTVAFLIVSVYVMFAPGFQQIRIGGLVFSLFAVFTLRGAYRPALRLRDGALVVDQPLWRWTIPAGALVGVAARRGVLELSTDRTTIIPFAFSSSVVANLVNADKHRREACRVIEDWRDRTRPHGARPRVVWSIRPVVVDAVAIVAGWQVVYSLVLLVTG